MESSFELKSEKMLFPGPSSASAGVKYWEIATTLEPHLLTGGSQYLSQFLTRLPFLVLGLGKNINLEQTSSKPSKMRFESGKNFNT